MNEVQVQPNLNLFLSKCKERDIKVGLSSWYRLDVDEVLPEIGYTGEIGGLLADNPSFDRRRGLLIRSFMWIFAMNGPVIHGPFFR